MKQKYSIIKNDKEEVLNIKEFGELEKEKFSLICEVALEYKDLKPALKEGKPALISVIRTPDLYPPAAYMDQIADEITNFFKSEDSTSTEIVIDDKDLLLQRAKDLEEEADIPDMESADIDVLPDEIDSLLDIEDTDNDLSIGKKVPPDIEE